MSDEREIMVNKVKVRKKTKSTDGPEDRQWMTLQFPLQLYGLPEETEWVVMQIRGA